MAISQIDSILDRMTASKQNKVAVFKTLNGRELDCIFHGTVEFAKRMKKRSFIYIGSYNSKSNRSEVRAKLISEIS